MTCQHCNKNLPEGLIMCFHCGEPLEASAGPVQPSHIVEPAPPPRLAQAHDSGLGVQAGGNKRGYVGIIVAVAVVLLLGGAVGGHFLGFYTLPLLPEVGDAVTPSVIGMPDTSPEDTAPAGNVGEGELPQNPIEREQSATIGTPDAAPIPTPDPTANGMVDSEEQALVPTEEQRLGSYATSNFQVINIPSGYRAEVSTQSLEVSIRGNESDLARITDASIRVVADLANASPGTSYVNARVYVDGFEPNAVGVVGEYSIMVNIIPEPPPQAPPSRSVIMPTTVLDPTGYNYVHDYITIVNTSATPADFGGYDLSVTLSNPLQAVTFDMYFSVVTPDFSGFDHEFLYDEFIVENFTMARNSTQTFIFHIPARVMENDNVKVLLYTVDGW